MAEAVKEYLGVDFMAIGSDEEAVKAAEAIGVDLSKTEKTWGQRALRVL
jgi:lysyl-tRNA synthetase class 2